MAPKNGLPSDEDWVLSHTEFIRSSATHNKPLILDLGCGAGRDSVFLTDFGHVVSADLSLDLLARCKSYAQTARPVCLDLSYPFPFHDSVFDFILASLSLHYFSWVDTKKAIEELRRCLAPNGRTIVRLNSTNDVNYGANSGDVIERHYFQVGNQKKRFFDAGDIHELFDRWHTESIREVTINRYAKYKTIWEVLLRAA